MNSKIDLPSQSNVDEIKENAEDSAKKGKLTNLQSCQRYMDLYHNEESHDQTIEFNPVEYLEKINRIFEEQTLYMCFRKKLCKCNDPSECDCDSDFYFQVSSIKFNVCLNCQAQIQIEFSLSLKLNFKHWPVLRFFKFDKSDEETPFLDIDTAKKTIRCFNSPGVCFEFTDKFCVNEKSCELQFDYMNFELLEE